MKNKRRTFSREYKLAAVKKVVEQGLSYSEVARDLGIRDSMLRNWQKRLQAEGAIEANLSSSSSVESELRRLREENRQLRMERDILKKATAYFAKENG